MKFYAVLSHFAKGRNLCVKSAPRLPKIKGGRRLANSAMPYLDRFIKKSFPKDVIAYGWITLLINIAWPDLGLDWLEPGILLELELGLELELELLLELGVSWSGTKPVQQFIQQEPSLETLYAER